MPESEPVLFALGSTAALGQRIAAHLELPLAGHEERAFAGGEHKARPLAEVAGRDVYVIHSLYGEPGQSPNDKLITLLFFIGALRDAGAARVTAVTPYLAYARKDRRTKPRDPVNSRYVAGLFESVGTAAIVAFEVHNVSAFENAFRSCRPEHLPAARLFAEHFAPQFGSAAIAVVSPDAGGNKRADLFRHELEKRLDREVGKAIMEKHRSSGVVSGSLLAGSVEGCTAIIVDDLIESGGTICRATAACRAAGAIQVIAAAAHPLFPASDIPLFGTEGPDRVIVTDSAALPPALGRNALARIEIIETAELFAEVIRRLNSGEPVSDMIPYD